MYRIGTVSFRDKLSRLALPPLGPEIPRAQVIERLRERIRTTLERPPKSPGTPPWALENDLPFDTTETPAGPLHVRQKRLSPGHRTGRAELGPAYDASAELLSLLALDPTLARCDVRGALFLDTETTGLARGAGTVAFLVGLAWWHGAGTFVLEQFLVRQLGEEAPMLERVRQRIEQASLLVTFNGKSFDLPLLRTRMVMARLPAMSEPPHLDLLHVARRVHGSRLTNGCRLSALESAVLGFERPDDVASADIGALYLHFLRTGDARALLGVVEHNAWDVITMGALVGLYGEPNHEALAAEDLAGVARTLCRAGNLERAASCAQTAVERSYSVSSIRARADISKARGDRARALADYEILALAVDDPGVRLELAKIYEHWVKAPRDALEWATRGTGERSEAATRRLERLARKASVSRRMARPSSGALALPRGAPRSSTRVERTGSNEAEDPEDPA
jgi:uncharacterized protein YprB with RNaseH-like and TPR domain